ncbi:MAG: hypothetical protein H6510_06095 [Acidobacteria bacterium]|nr:hypothetical protein [Acidobacteriota bacterium]MCB9397365.1 hypothetical protein [Acidobacteriota bacterium]
MDLVFFQVVKIFLSASILTYGTPNNANSMEIVPSFPLSYPTDYQRVDLVELGLKPTEVRARHRALFKYFVEGEPLTPHSFAELVGTLGYKAGKVTVNMEFRVSKMLFDLSEPDRISVFNHEYQHFLDLKDPVIQNRLVALPGPIQKKVLEARAYAAEMAEGDWSQCTERYRKKILNHYLLLIQYLHAWNRSTEPMGSLSLEFLMQDHSRSVAKNLLAKAKTNLVGSLVDLENSKTYMAMSLR